MSRDAYIPLGALRCPHCTYWTTGHNPVLYLRKHIKRMHSVVRDSAQRMIENHRPSLDKLGEASVGEP